MSDTLRRSVASRCCRALQSILPAHLECWGWAIRYEVDDIPDDTEALLFALESLWSLVPRAIAFRFLRPSTVTASDTLNREERSVDMGFFDQIARRPRTLGIACAIFAVGLGVVYMTMAGAPISYMAINGAALILGLTFLAFAAGSDLAMSPSIGAMVLILAVGLFTTALVGNQVEGAARWLKLGPLYIQPSLIVLPVMILGFVRRRDKLSALGIIIAAAAMALQPDRAMAAMLVAALMTLAILRPDRPTMTALGASIIGLCITLMRSDTLPAVPFVDQVLFSSFDVHMLAGLSVLTGTVLLVVPALVGVVGDQTHREAHIVCVAIWISLIAAAALGNYPTPVVGYSGAAVLGYVLSLLMLPPALREDRVVKASIQNESGSDDGYDRSLRFGAELCTE